MPDGGPGCPAGRARWPVPGDEGTDRRLVPVPRGVRVAGAGVCGEPISAAPASAHAKSTNGSRASVAARAVNDRGGELSGYLLRSCARQVLGALVRRGSEFDAVEDAVQEALLEAIARWARIGDSWGTGRVADDRHPPQHRRCPARRGGSASALSRQSLWPVQSSRLVTRCCCSSVRPPGAASTAAVPALFTMGGVLTTQTCGRKRVTPSPRSRTPPGATVTIEVTIA